MSTEKICDVLQAMIDTKEEFYLEDPWIGEHLAFGYTTRDVRQTPQQVLDEWIERGQGDTLVTNDGYYISLYSGENDKGDPCLYRLRKGSIPEHDEYSAMLADNRRLKQLGYLPGRDQSVS